MNKRGIVDVLYITLMLFIFAIVLVISLKMFGTILNDLNAQHPNVNVAKNMADEFPDMLRQYNVLFIVIFVFGILASIITAFFIQTHPVIAVISFFILIIFTVFAGSLSNVYEEFRTDPAISAQANEFPLISTFFNDLPKYMVIAMILVIIVSYAKISRNPGGI